MPPPIKIYLRIGSGEPSQASSILAPENYTNKAKGSKIMANEKYQAKISKIPLGKSHKQLIKQKPERKWPKEAYSEK